MQGEKRGRGGRSEGKKKKEGGQRAREKDRVRVMETGSEPETRPQKSNYRSSREGAGPAPGHIFTQHKALPDMQSQAHTQALIQQKTCDEQRTEMDEIGEDHG